MSYAVRNTLFIATFWAVVLAVGFYFIYGKQAKVLARQLAENKKKSERLEELMFLEKDKSALINRLEELRRLTSQQIGTLVKNESPGETFDYLLRELKKTSPELDFNLVFVEEDSIFSCLGRTYEISGECRFTDFYNLVWLLENGPIFYDIKSLSMERLDGDTHETLKTEPRDIKFTMNVLGFERKEGPDIAEIKGTNGRPEKVVDIVTNKVRTFAENQRRRLEHSVRGGAPKGLAAATSGPTQKPSTPSLAKAKSEIKVLALTPNSAIILTPDGKKLRIRKGQKFGEGYLKDIDLVGGRLIFEKTSGGVPARFILQTTK